ncbi:hypothetical protein PanWU01x14_104440 [Parasponia andersonii]|uniref:Uncharacterized protein n=1 Tax=Parasponia andersonii TaxID=3476 RepID=A0A2P5D1U3_PARAD|nr:hypothetical protein PanWU01x14_104440 [Parasponia andersonii]
MSVQGGWLGTHDRVPGGTGRVAEGCERGAPARGMRAHHRGTTGRDAQDACAPLGHTARSAGRRAETWPLPLPSATSQNVPHILEPDGIFW